MKISQKLLILFLLNALLPLVIVAAFSYSNTQQALRKQVDIDVNNAATRQVARVKATYDANSDTLGLFPTLTSVGDSIAAYLASPTPNNQAKLNLALNDTHRFDNSYRRLHVLNLDGKVIGSTDLTMIGKDFKDSPMYKNGRTRGDVSVFFKDADGKLAHYAFAPMQRGNKVIAYALLETPPEDYLLVTQDYSGLGDTGETLLLGPAASGGDEYLLPGRFDNKLALTAYKVSASNGTIDYRQHKVVSVQRDIAGTPWRLIIKIDQGEVFRPLYQLRNLTLIITLGTAVIIIMLGLFFSRRITSPIRRFTDIVKRIQGGDYALRVPIESKDEIGVLAVAFNSMTGQLAESNRALEVKVIERTKSLDQKVQELSNAKAKDEAILDSIGDGMIVTDNSGQVLLINTIAANFLGVDKNAMVQKSLSTIFLYDERGELIPPQDQPTQVALETKRKVELNVWAKGEGDKKTALAVTATPVLQQGVIIGTIQTLRDVTKEKQVDRMKTEFISLASHQLRTPLSAIRWFTEMLMSGDAGKLSTEQSDFAKNIYDSTERMIQLVNSLLNISRIESGRIIVEPKPTDLQELVNGVVNDLKAKTEEKQQTLIVSVHKDLPKVNLDPRLIGQVYMNFLTNAIKYTPKGGEISVFVSRKDEELVSQITDNGYGIPKEQQHRVFQKFFRAENIAKVETDGTGLGLYLVKAVIESSGGRVWFQSEPGKGTTFWFTLPMSGMKAKAGEVTLS